MNMTLGDLIAKLNRKAIISNLPMSKIQVLVNMDGYDFDIESIDDVDFDHDQDGNVIRIHLSTV